ncbi:hypothetical protein KJ611_00745 [Patescibacteria group bacterium]|nr:hypothetical protein [Patescibacteria group bacterium]MBU1705582.1 hypothetical protein [Patescibacteria group bacterium]
MIKQKTVLRLVIILVVAGTSVALFSLAPEAVRLRSADGCFVLSGEIGSGSEAAFSERLDLAGPFSLMIGPVYEIDFGSNFLPGPFHLTLCVQPEWGAVNELAIYAYDEELSAWRLMPSVADPLDLTLATEIRTPFSLWAVGRKQKFDQPAIHESLLSELLAWPPAEAVGYRVYSSFAAVDGDFVLVNGRGQRGGCSGVYFSGPDQAITSVERATEGGVYRLSVIWEMGGGCMEGEEISAD